MGYSPRGHKESDRTEQLTLNSALFGVQRCSGKNWWGGVGIGPLRLLCVVV